MTLRTRRGALGGLAAGAVSIGAFGLNALSGGAPAHARAQGLRDLLDPQSGPVFDAGRTDTGWLALEDDPASLVFRGLLQGAPVRVLLDSGASHSVIDARLARRLRLEAGSVQDVRDTAGLATRGVGLAGVSLRLPGLTFLDLSMVALDLSPLAQTGQEVPIILGSEAFETLVVEIDRAGARLAFRDPAALRPPAGARSLPLLADGGRTRTLPLSVEGAAPVQAQFDLGAQSPMTASLAFAQRRGWLDGKRVSTWAAASVAGVTAERIASFDRVSLAGLPLPPAPVELLAQWDAPDAPLLAGCPLLTRFHLWVDYPGDRLWLAPSPGLDRPFRRNRSGLALQPAPGGGSRVVHVAAGSPAARAGWRAGEVIARAADAQGRPAGDDWGYGPAGSTWRLTLPNGDVRGLTLADYF